MRQMLTPGDAQRLVLETVAALPTETLPLAECRERTLARDIASPLDLPPFDNSAMDGYALRADDVAEAAPHAPVMLQVRETLAAGDAPQTSVEAGFAARIMTGAPLPPGAEAVVMRENTRESPACIEVLEAVAAGANIRRAGSDIRKGEVALRAGTRIRPAEWGLLASLGQAEVEVFRAPRVAIIVTGEELVAPGMPLRAGQIHDSNSWTLRGLAAECGVPAARVLRCGDDPARLETLLRECACECDAIVTSGGVSMGDFDPVRDVLPRVGDVLFWKLAMKPGKPVMFARISEANGRGVPVFGLPGNPVSVMVAWELLVRPALLKLQGRADLLRAEVPARVDVDFRSPPGREEYARVWIEAGEAGVWRARLTGDQGSGRLSTMTRANALLRVPASTERVQAGDILPALLTDLPGGSSSGAAGADV